MYITGCKCQLGVLGTVPETVLLTKSNVACWCVRLVRKCQLAVPALARYLARRTRQRARAGTLPGTPDILLIYRARYRVGPDTLPPHYIQHLHPNTRSLIFGDPVRRHGTYVPRPRLNRRAR